MDVASAYHTFAIQHREEAMDYEPPSITVEDGSCIVMQAWFL